MFRLFKKKRRPTGECPRCGGLMSISLYRKTLTCVDCGHVIKLKDIEGKKKE